jgi:hypothetical protein
MTSNAGSDCADAPSSTPATPPPAEATPGAAARGNVPPGGSTPKVPPFAHLRPALAVAAAYGAAIVVWLAGGDALPGGRWFAVHLFTLGVLTNLVMALTHHFAQTLLHAAPSGSTRRRFLLLNAGALLVLGFPPAWRIPLAVGAAATSAAVLWLYLDLRRMRKQALTQRFCFVVRAYQRACSAFLHGALLGALLGVGVLSGGWYVAARYAHLHVQVLGWGGLVLLATVVFFGPTVLRTRMEPGADRTAVPALRHGATALTVAVVALLLTGAGDPVALPARLVAAVGLAGYAAAATLVCVPVLRAARRARGNVNGRLVAGACAWFPLLAWAGAGVVALGQWSLLDALGAGLLVGVLSQAILGSLAYLAPMAFAAGSTARTRARTLLERFEAPRLLVHNAAAAALVVAVAGSRLGSADLGILTLAGLLLLGASVLGHVLLGTWAVTTARRAV